MNIRNFLQTENTPVPVTRDLTPGMQQAFRAANSAVRQIPLQKIYNRERMIGLLRKCS